MPRQTASAIVPYTPQQMYDLVVDMKSYPKFIPWCAHGASHDHRPDQFIAEITFTFKGVRETFRTLDRVVPGRQVRISLLSGPFSNLESCWDFTPLAEGCKIDFYIDFQFKNKLMDLALGPAFGLAAKKMVDAFHKRADDLYRHHSEGDSP